MLKNPRFQRNCRNPAAKKGLGYNTPKIVIRILPWIFGWNFSFCFPENLSGPLNRLNAILSLLQPLDRYRTPSAIGSAIGRPLSRPISHPNTGGSPQPPRSKPLGGAQPRDSGAIVSKKPLKTSAKQKRDRGRDSQTQPRPQLNSQPQGATKLPNCDLNFAVDFGVEFFLLFPETLLRLSVLNNLARQKIASKKLQIITSRGYFGACCKGYFWRNLKHQLQKIKTNLVRSNIASEDSSRAP